MRWYTYECDERNACGERRMHECNDKESFQSDPAVRNRSNGRLYNEIRRDR